MSTTSPPAGWYHDNDRSGSEWWWNGSSWTDHRKTRTAGRAPSFSPDPSVAPYYLTRQVGDSTVVTMVNSPAKAAIVLAVIGILINPLCVISIVAIVFGSLGLSRAAVFERAGDPPVGRIGSAWAIGLGIASTAVWVLIFTGLFAQTH